jgi:hypothetical protein
MELKHHCIYDQFRSSDKCKNGRKLLKLTEAFLILFVFNTTKGVWGQLYSTIIPEIPMNARIYWI